jgi:hypothetical protein
LAYQLGFRTSITRSSFLSPSDLPFESSPVKVTELMLTFNGHRKLVPLLSGLTKIPEDVPDPEFVFVKGRRSQRFIGAGPLAKAGPKGQYGWRLTVPRELITELGDQMELWTFNPDRNSFLKIQDAKLY